MNKNSLVIIIDPGFDQYKITINEKVIAFPSTMVKVDNGHSGLALVKGNFYFYPDNGDTYLFGQGAWDELLGYDSAEANNSLLESNMDIKRFQSGFFKYSLEAALAYALYQFEHSDEGQAINFQIKDLDSYKIYFGVALPHDVLQEAAPHINAFLRTRHNFQYRVAGEMSEKEDFTFDLNNAKLFVNSQAICAFLFEALNDDATDNEEVERLLPALIIDAGQKTLGIFLLNKNHHIYSAESNMEYAMFNIYERVAARINEELPGCEFKPYQVREYMKDNMPVNFNKKSVYIDPIYKEEFDHVCAELCDTLTRTRSQQLNSCRSVFIAGGTGAAYYKPLKSYMNENFPYAKVILTNKTSQGTEIEPIFAVVLGMRKYVLGRIAMEE